MIHRISQRITDFLCDNGIIQKEEADIYIYGYEAVLSGLVDFLLVLAAGILFHCLDRALVFFAMFISVRMYTGGYHADTYLRCKLIMVMLLLAVLWIATMKLPLTAICLLMILLILTVYFQAPVEHPNKPLDEAEKKKYHRYSLILSLLWGAAAIVLYFIRMDLAAAIAVTAFSITMLMVIEIFRKENNYEE
ncbi:MAG: accessory gene regulator B family protein [Oscillospiraceae bacterium]|nr:accessory gene regulator B family protein [Oscillospiraceae bacterium]